MTEGSDPPTAFDPDGALEEIRELCRADGLEARGDPLAVLVARLDDHLFAGCGALPQDWQPDPGVIAERFFRNQPRRTSRAERRR